MTGESLIKGALTKEQKISHSKEDEKTNAKIRSGPSYLGDNR
jgi:hypothetical protein